MNYLVMECHLSYAVVLDEEGRFLTVANLRYQVGQRVSEVVVLQPPEEGNVTPFPAEKTAKRARKRWAASLTAVAACLMLAVGSSLWLAVRNHPVGRIDLGRT